MFYVCTRILLNPKIVANAVNNKGIALLLAGVIISGLIYTHPAYAHNFGGDESASWLAKVAEIKTEVGVVAKHVGDKDVVGYFSDKLTEYWNSNDTREMGERNTLLQKEIPTTINATLTDAAAGDQSAVNADVSKLNGYLDESIPVRVDKDKLDNATVQALAVTFVLKEALEKYGDALNSTVDLNDMSQMNLSGSMSGSSMSGGSMATSMIVDKTAHENSVALAIAAQQMFSDVASKYPDKSSDNAKISSALAKLVQDLTNKADANTIMIDAHVDIHPTIISAYNIQEAKVPEFPMPALLAIISIAGVVAATRLKPILGF